MVLWSCAVFVAIYAAVGLFFVGEDAPAWVGVWLSLAFVLLPVSIGIAILRYRLYDIDVIIRKTLVYTVLTALLAVIYFGGWSSCNDSPDDRGLVRSGDCHLTLVIAALFFPLRRHVQSAIDRRFYRASTTRPRPSPRSAPPCGMRWN